MRKFSTAGPVAPLRALRTVESFLNSKTQATTDSLRQALVACTTLEAAYAASSRPDYHELPTQRDPAEARALLDDVLRRAFPHNSQTAGATTASTNQGFFGNVFGASFWRSLLSSPSPRITHQTLLEFFTSEHPPSTSAALKVLRAYAQTSPRNVVPEPIAMIPFRRAVYAADFRGALDVMDHTCGVHSNYRAFMDRKIARNTGLWGAGIGSALVGVHSALMSGLFGVWDAGTSALICVMFGTYLTALSVYGTMAIQSSKSGLGPVLEWVPGTSPLYRMRHGMQLKMATFATELNRSLPENLGEVSPQLMLDLNVVNLRPVETREEAYLKEYWARAGAGFEWVEPDQDPAVLLWTSHMEATRQQRISSPYSRKDGEGRLLSWVTEAEREKEGRSFPHASLLHIEDVHTEAGMQAFEKELEEDMRRIKGKDDTTSLPPNEDSENTTENNKKKEGNKDSSKDSKDEN